MIEWQDFPRSRPGHRITRAELSAPAPYTRTVGIDWYCHSDGCRLYPASPLDSVLRGFDILTAWRNDHRYAGYGVSVADHTALVIRLAKKYAIDAGWSRELTDLFIRGGALHEGGEAIVKDQITMTKRALPQLAAMDDVWTAAIAEGAGVDWLVKAVTGSPLTEVEYQMALGLRHVDLLALSTEMTLAHHDGRWDIPGDIWVEPTDWSIEMAREVASTGRWLDAHPEAHDDAVAAYVWRNIWRGQERPNADFCFMTALRKRREGRIYP